MPKARCVTVFVLMAGLAVGLMSCKSDGGETLPPTMPDVTGARLDVAKSDIERAGFDGEVEVLGGGTFGVVDETNWIVCEQVPAEGEAIGDSPRLAVDRSCGDDAADEDEEAADTTSPTTTVPPADEESPGIDADAMEAAFIAGLGIPIFDMCAGAANDPSWTKGPHWACYYAGVEAAPGYLQINLGGAGDQTPPELDELAYDTGLAWFNFIGCEFPNLDMIVVTIDGLDHNVPRSSTNADLLCD